MAMSSSVWARNLDGLLLLHINMGVAFQTISPWFDRFLGYRQTLDVT